MEALHSGPRIFFSGVSATGYAYQIVEELPGETLLTIDKIRGINRTDTRLSQEEIKSVQILLAQLIRHGVWIKDLLNPLNIVMLPVRAGEKRAIVVDPAGIDILERDRLDVKQLAQRYVVYNGMGVRKDLWNQMDPEGEVFGFLELIEEFGEEALKGGDEVKSQSSPIHERQDFDSLPKEVGGIALDAQQLKGFTL